MGLDERVTGKSKIIGILGCPIGHTVSPQLHNTLSSTLGINAIYVPFTVDRDKLGDAVKGLKACNVTGFNVTIPFKEEILEYVDEYSNEVALIGSANTVLNKKGRLYAYNTDAEGFARSFAERMETGFKGEKVILLGAGGTARSLAVKIASAGVRKLYIANRTVKKAENIADIINKNIGNIAEAKNIFEVEKSGLIKECRIIINTTPLGMYPHTSASPLGDDAGFDAAHIICDVIYNPARTRFLENARRSGCKTMNGMGMLFYQGVLAYEIWMGSAIPEDKIKTLSAEFLKYLDN